MDAGAGRLLPRGGLGGDREHPRRQRDHDPADARGEPGQGLQDVHLGRGDRRRDRLHLLRFGAEDERQAARRFTREPRADPAGGADRLRLRQPRRRPPRGARGDRRRERRTRRAPTAPTRGPRAPRRWCASTSATARAPFFVFNGTGANVASIDALTRPCEAVICTGRGAHARRRVRRAGAARRAPSCSRSRTEHGKLASRRPRSLGGAARRRAPGAAAARLDHPVDRARDRLLARRDAGRSPTPPIELGMYLHVDGARLANAAAALGAGARRADHRGRGGRRLLRRHQERPHASARRSSSAAPTSPRTSPSRASSSASSPRRCASSRPSSRRCSRATCGCAKRRARQRDGGPAGRRGRVDRRGRDHPAGRGERGLRPPRAARRSTGCSTACPGDHPFYIWDDASRRGALDVRLGYQRGRRRRLRRRDRRCGRLTFAGGWSARCSSGRKGRRVAERIETVIVRRCRRRRHPRLLAGRPVRVEGQRARRPRCSSRCGSSASAAGSKLALGRDRTRAGAAATPAPSPGRGSRSGEVRDLELPGPAGPIAARLYRPAGLAEPGAADRLLPRRRPRDLRSRHPRPAVSLPRQRDPGAGALGRLPARPRAPLPGRGRGLVRGVRWAHAEAGRLGADPRRIAVAGDSAGGNLATVVAQLAAAGDGPRAGVPGADLPGDRLLVEARLVRRPSPRASSSPAPRWTGFATTTSPAAADRADPRASPILADRPVRDAAGSHRHGRLRPASRRGRGLRRARCARPGSAVTLRREPDLVHGFINAVGLGGRSRAGAAVDRSGDPRGARAPLTLPSRSGYPAARCPDSSVGRAPPW